MKPKISREFTYKLIEASLHSPHSQVKHKFTLNSNKLTNTHTHENCSPGIYRYHKTVCAQEIKSNCCFPSTCHVNIQQKMSLFNVPMSDHDHIHLAQNHFNFKIKDFTVHFIVLHDGQVHFPLTWVPSVRTRRRRRPVTSPVTISPIQSLK